jgi:6-pyruvoyltetrahydropterin/6-carboxytetrahydropterin synthase
VYAVTVRTDFIAQHFLFGGDWGRENQRNSHHYVLELELEGEELDEHGYLVDIVAVDSALADARAAYADRLLNDLAEFEGLNPSLEHFARILWQRLSAELATPAVHAISVRLWENEAASASYTQPLR